MPSSTLAGRLTSLLARRYNSDEGEMKLCGLFLVATYGLLAQSGFSWPEGKRVAVSLSFDDARASQVDVGVPLFDKHGAKVTLYVNARNLGSRVEAWKKAAAAGHEIGDHTNSHPCTLNLPFSAKNA